MGGEFSAPGTHSASYTMVTGSSPGVKSVRAVTLTAHPLLVPWSRRAELYLYSPYELYGLYRALAHVQGALFLSTLISYMHSDVSTGIIISAPFAVISSFTSSSSPSYICHAVGPPVDPFRSHVSRSLLKGLPRFLLPVGQ